MAQENIKHEKRKKRPRTCKLATCAARFVPARSNQIFCCAAHRQEYWERIQDTQAAADYQRFLLVRDKFARYLKFEASINKWLKTNKK